MENVASLPLLQALKFKDENSGPFVSDQKGQVKRSLEKDEGSAALSYTPTGLSHREEGKYML